LLLNSSRRWSDAAAVAVALVGIAVLWSRYLDLARLSLWYDSTQVLAASAAAPDYDLTTLHWETVHPRAFDIQQGALRLVTSADPYGYQAYATIKTNGANTAGIAFEADVESGGVSIGLLQAGSWLTTNSSLGVGRFSESNSALLGFRRSLMVVIANRNAAGESRATIKSLKLYLRR
jgi:hypothetical protein